MTSKTTYHSKLPPGVFDTNYHTEKRYNLAYTVLLVNGEIKDNRHTTGDKRWVFYQDAAMKVDNVITVFHRANDSKYYYYDMVEALRLAVDPNNGARFAILKKIAPGDEYSVHILVYSEASKAWEVETYTSVHIDDLKVGLFFATEADEAFGLACGDLVVQRFKKGGRTLPFKILRRTDKNKKGFTPWYTVMLNQQSVLPSKVIEKLGFNKPVDVDHGRIPASDLPQYLRTNQAFESSGKFYAYKSGSIVHLYRSKDFIMNYVETFSGEGAEVDYGYKIEFPSDEVLVVYSKFDDGSGRLFKYAYTEVADDQWVLSSKAIIEPIPVKPYVKSECEPGVEQEVAGKVATPTLTKEEKVFLDYIIEQEKRAMEQAAYYCDLKNKILSKK